MGDKCDQCQPFNSDLSPAGCQPCGECEQMIRAGLEDASMQLRATEVKLDLFTALYNADINGSSRINDSLQGLDHNVTSVRNILDAVELRLDALELVTRQVDGRGNSTLVDVSYLAVSVWTCNLYINCFTCWNTVPVFILLTMHNYSGCFLGMYI